MALIIASWMGASPASASAGTQYAHDHYGYPYPNAPDCDEYGSSGCVVDNRGFFQGQCTSWVAYRLAQMSGIDFNNWYHQPSGQRWSDASNWGAAAQRAGIAVNGTPALGAVAWYSSGHVGYVEQVNSDGSAVMSEMNRDRHNGFQTTTISPGNRWPTGFIHIADRQPAPPPPLVGVQPVTSTATAGWFVKAPIEETFTYKNTTDQPISANIVVLAVRDPFGDNYDQSCGANITIAPGATQTCRLTQQWGSVGTYTIWPDWRDNSGNWHPGQLGATQKFTLSAQPPLFSIKSLDTRAPSGWFVKAPIEETFTYKNTTDQPISANIVVLAVRDPFGDNYDQSCGANITIAPGATQTCRLTQQWGSVGTYTIWPDWRDNSGNWHPGQLGAAQTFSLQRDDSLPTAEITGARGSSGNRRLIRISWSGHDMDSGVTSFDIRWRAKRSGKHSWSAWVLPAPWTRTSETSGRFQADHTRSTYCFSVRSADGVGNQSPWSRAMCART